ncbi:MAG TPA: VWA domain-containing protein [Nocardioidaceae bacterium]
MPDDSHPFVETLVAFGGELREAGLSVGSGDVLTYSASLAALDPSDLLDVYWAGRAALVARRDEIDVYDRVFRRFFLGEDAPTESKPYSPEARSAADAVLQVPETEPGGVSREDREARLGLVASDVATLRSKSFAACTTEELEALHRIMRAMRLSPPRRRTRRTAPAGSGVRPDMRRTIRETMRMHGEPSSLYWRRRRLRPRPLILILDVSGSMADYSRNLLQFAYSTRRVTARVEVFCFGTRLTRITRELEHRKPDEALDRAAKAVVDWDGGTRIGASLDAFVRDWGRRGVCRGGIVVICSDGLDRGDPGVLAAAMERLSRLSHRVVWMNPHKGDDIDFQPSTLGMMVAAPHIDVLYSGHDLRSLAEFAARLPELS